jgi:two-component sensor histidine kinase
MHILAWRSSQPAIVRWLQAIAVFMVAFSARFWLGVVHGANPALTFYPAIIVAAVLLGWREAVLILALSVTVGAYFFLPPGMYLLPVAWLLVGGLNIAIIAGLKSLAEQLAAANERQRILFQEVQHRVANTLQAVVGTVEIAKRRITFAPAEATRLLEEMGQRLAASADVHRRLHDPTLFSRGLDAVLRDAVVTVVDRRSVRLVFDVEELDLTFDQMSTITMLVIEAVNNAQKHVFHHGHGSELSVSLKRSPNGHATLTIRDDGPGKSALKDEGPTEQGLGLRIVDGLAKQIRGTLRISSGQGTEIAVEFPLVRQRPPAPSPPFYRSAGPVTGLPHTQQANSAPAAASIP